LFLADSEILTVFHYRQKFGGENTKNRRMLGDLTKLFSVKYLTIRKIKVLIFVNGTQKW